MQFINFFPGNSEYPRFVEVSEVDIYDTVSDLGDFLHSMCHGFPASVELDGAKDLLEDSVIMHCIAIDYGIDEVALQKLTEEIRAVISPETSQDIFELLSDRNHEQ